MHTLLPNIRSPLQLRDFDFDELERLAEEIRVELRSICKLRSAHFGSNLGVVELCLALHRVYDFSQDRIIWDTGHQIYPHKLITGRYPQIQTIRTKGGLMGFPNPQESPYDLFVTGHAGCSVSCAMGLKAADDLLDQEERRSVAVIGDGALPSGIVFEALNNAGAMRKNLLVVLNDNRMSICPRVGSVARYLDKTPQVDYPIGLRRRKRDPRANPAEFAEKPRAAKPYGGLFEDLGFRYIGPIDGHDLKMLVQCLEDLKPAGGPILLHVQTEKGHGFEPAVKDPVKFHAPARFDWDGEEIVPLASSSPPAYTNVASEAIHAAMRRNSNVVAVVAAMCEGNKLQKVRAQMPGRFFDCGICESHAVAFSSGMAKSGARPVVAIYSTFMQRAYDQLYQELSLQNLPVTLCLDRAGLAGPDGPTHHGVFDLAYLRSLPNFTIMAPGDAADLPLMFDLALTLPGPASIRYPKADAERVARSVAPVEVGRAEVIRWGDDGMLIACGALLGSCVTAAERLRADGLDVGVINARFVKPLDRDTILTALRRASFVLTVEEGTLEGGFGSAVLEAANAAGVDARHVMRLGIPDRYIEHGEREELLSDLGLTVDGICQRTLSWAEHCGIWHRDTVRIGTAHERRPALPLAALEMAPAAAGLVMQP
ncbi:MAG: 1-deoxy-D-xylulose-5-phosphate synthase [Planctomycetia bacterium 21-64-5]|nr:MAG: 1-deoxy-D-xylulose-5-phosphate synthase [Planctomycetia bacterium 21-64-5]HQU45213.1 1-deoxy-D-xylulose-5-phosphate synthase [Pirellulales bacterium]